MGINKKRETMREKAHHNYMDGLSYDLSPFATLYVMSCSAFFGEPGYYDDARRRPVGREDCYDKLVRSFGSFGKQFKEMSGLNREEAMKKAIIDAINYDPELTLKFLGWLRNVALIRSTSDVGLAISSTSDKVRGTGLIGKYGLSILSRLDDATNTLAYYLDTFGKPIPNSLKKVIAERIANASEYELAKYTAKNKSVSLMDTIRLTHAHSDAIDKFYKGELSQVKEGQETWEGIISNEGSNHDSWTKAVGVMGHMALLRNLRNLEKFEVDPSLYLDKLVEGVAKGKQLPFRYYSAYQSVSNSDTRIALEKCIDISIMNLPILKGSSLILVDNSGSAQRCQVSKMSSASVSDVGNLMGVLTGLVSEYGSKIAVFGDRVEYIPINKNFKGTALQLHHTVNKIGERIGEATENGIWLALRDIIQSGERFNRIFIYSDMQAGHGELYGFDDEKYPAYGDSHYGRRYIDIPALVAQYRQKVNPDCMLYSFQIGGYSDNVVPEFYPNTCIAGGWSAEALKFAVAFEKDPMSIEDHFRKVLDCPKKQ